MAGEKKKRAAKRTLVRWTDDHDKKLLLSMQYICNREGIKIPWAKVANVMGPLFSEGAVVQHLAKLRIRIKDQGGSVPPDLLRGGGYPIKGSASSSKTKALPASKSPDYESDDGEDSFNGDETSGSEEELMASQSKRAKHNPEDMGKAANSDKEDAFDTEETFDVEDVARPKSNSVKQESKGKGRNLKGKMAETKVEEVSDDESFVAHSKSKAGKQEPKGKGRQSKGKEIAKPMEDMLVTPKVGEKRKRQRGNMASSINKGDSKGYAKKLNDSHNGDDTKGDDEGRYYAIGADFLEIERMENANAAAAAQSKIVALKIGNSEHAKQFMLGLNNEEGMVTNSNDVSETDSEDKNVTEAMQEANDVTSANHEIDIMNQDAFDVNEATMIQGSQKTYNLTGRTDFGTNLVSGNRFHQPSNNITNMGAMAGGPFPNMTNMANFDQAKALGSFNNYQNTPLTNAYQYQNVPVPNTYVNVGYPYVGYTGIGPMHTPHGGVGELIDPANSFFNTNSHGVPYNPAFNPNNIAAGNSLTSGVHEGTDGFTTTIGSVHNMAAGWNNGSGFSKGSAVLQNMSPSQIHGTSSGSVQGMSENSFGNGEVGQSSSSLYDGYPGNELSNTQKSSPGLQEPMEQHGTPGVAHQAINDYPNAVAPHRPSSFVASMVDDTPDAWLDTLPNPDDLYYGDYLNVNLDDSGDYYVLPNA